VLPVPGRRSLLARVRQHITPFAVACSFFFVLGASAIIGAVANIVSIQVALKTVGSEAPLVIGMAGTPKPYQYENKLRIHSTRGTITLPVHSGSVTQIIGPVDLSIAAGETLSWDPGADLANVDYATKWVFAISDVDGVTLTGVGSDTFTLNPGAYIPEALVPPFSIVAPATRAVRVTLVVGIDYVAGGGDVDL
jgi:hypothetical protein